MVRPRPAAGLARKKALVVFETVWKVRRSVGKVGKRIRRCLYMRPKKKYLEGVRCAALYEQLETPWLGGGELELGPLPNRAILICNHVMTSNKPHISIHWLPNTNPTTDQHNKDMRYRVGPFLNFCVHSWLQFVPPQARK